MAGSKRGSSKGTSTSKGGSKRPFPTPSVSKGKGGTTKGKGGY